MRNFANANRSSIVNIVYIVAALVVVYYLAMFYLSKDNLDVTLLERPTRTTDMEQRPLTIYDGEKNVERRITPGGEYTISAWLYIDNWSTTLAPVFSVYEPGSINDTEPILAVALYPNEPKMVVRAGKIAGKTLNLTSLDLPSNQSQLDPCDLVDIDMQRWIFLTVSVNGRIMDVYMDGKLARSCILSNPQSNIGSKTNKQMLIISSGSTKMSGQISGVRFSAYAVTPDQIYAQYQAGPYTYVGFLDYLKSKIGITVTYAGKAQA